MIGAEGVLVAIQTSMHKLHFERFGIPWQIDSASRRDGDCGTRNTAEMLLSEFSSERCTDSLISWSSSELLSFSLSTSNNWCRGSEIAIGRSGWTSGIQALNPAIILTSSSWSNRAGCLISGWNCSLATVLNGGIRKLLILIPLWTIHWTGRLWYIFTSFNRNLPRRHRKYCARRFQLQIATSMAKVSDMVTQSWQSSRRISSGRRKKGNLFEDPIGPYHRGNATHIRQITKSWSRTPHQHARPRNLWITNTSK